MKNSTIIQKKGFTLMELMIVIAIIGVLTAIAIPNFISYKKKARCSAVESDAQSIEAAISDYFSDPTHDKTPEIESLRGYTVQNQAKIEDVSDGIRITVTDNSKRCQRGDYFILSIPANTSDGWSK